MDTRWRIELLGRLRATQGDRTVTRFRARKTGALLAYLANHLDRPHPRELLIELLWPGVDLPSGRSSLSRELTSLRRQLEPPGVPEGAVILADRASVQLNPAACETDVQAFETGLQHAERARCAAERTARLTEAAELYHGELLPGYFDDWILHERQRLAELFFHALEDLTASLAQAGDHHGAIQWARRAVAADPLREEAHQELIRLFQAAGQPAAALRQYHELERLLAQELGATPAPETAALVCRVTDAPTGAPSLHPRVRRSARSRKDNGPENPEPPPRRLDHAGESSTAPPPILVAAATSPRSLPLSFTRFFGRQPEIQSLRALLLTPDVRLVTLLGPGGTGKTRLALETARQLQPDLAGRVWFVSLLDLTDPRLIADKLLDTLRIPRSPQIEPVDQIAAFLSADPFPGSPVHAPQPALFVLDNFEHLVEGGRDLVRTLLERVENLKVLVTSRRCLGLQGEQEFPVPPLPVPADASDPAELARCPSARLFVDRAQAVRPDFQLTRSNATAVAALCGALEGLPLALELAAARIGVLTPQQMLDRLEQRFDLLASGRRGADPRHRSLRAALDWSYQLLSPELQRFFARLSVFRGGWTLEAAEAVWQQPDALDFLMRLREFSLVEADESAGQVRFRLLETLREFGAEQLGPDERAALARRHAAYYLAMAQQAEAEFCSPAQETWLERLEADHPNLRTALAWCQSESGDVELGLRLGAALWWFWHLRDHDAEGRGQLERLLARSEGVPLAVRARAQACAGLLSFWQGDLESASALSQESLAVAQTLGDPWTIAFSLRNLGQVALFQNNCERAQSLWEEGLSIWREMGDKWGIAMSYDRLSCLAQARHDWAAARALAESGLVLRRGLGDPQGIARALEVLGLIARSQGDLVTARSLCEESLAIRRSLGTGRTIAFSLSGLGLVCYEKGELEEARVHLEESLKIQRELGNRHFIASALVRLALVVAAQGQLRLGQTLLHESLSIGQEIGDRDYIRWSLQHLGDIARREGDAGQAAALLSGALDLARDADDRECLAGCLSSAAAIAAAQEQPERAVRLLGAAAALRESFGRVLPPAERVAQECLLTAQRPLLGDAVFATAWEAGWALTPEQAVGEVRHALGVHELGSLSHGEPG
jgi:predicted ATPase/DNA-binding SARP family transcriptional activator